MAKVAKSLKVPDLVSSSKPSAPQKTEEVDPMKAELFKQTKPKPKQSEAPKEPTVVVETKPSEPVYETKPSQPQPTEEPTPKEEPKPEPQQEDDGGLA